MLTRASGTPSGSTSSILVPSAAIAVGTRQGDAGRVVGERQRRDRSVGQQLEVVELALGDGQCWAAGLVTRCIMP